MDIDKIKIPLKNLIENVQNLSSQIFQLKKTIVSIMV